MNPTNSVITPGTAIVNISPIGFHAYALEFAKSARQAHAALGGQFSPVPYYLYCHSLELVLKAFLLAQGVPIDDLKNAKKLGHNLTKVLHKAKQLGLEKTTPLATGWEAEIFKANAYYDVPVKGFEYFLVMKAVRQYPDLPGLDILNEMVTNLLKGLEKVCLDA